MNRTQIECVKNPDGSQGYAWNPITGCLNHINGLCKGGGFPCSAYKLANGRVKPLYLANNKIAPPKHIADGHWLGDPFYPRFWEERLEISHTRRFHRLKERQRYRDRGIFVCDMGDLFGIGIPEEWTWRVLEQIKLCANDRFYLLTKQPQNLIKFSPFPDNCWVGVTATTMITYQAARNILPDVEARIKFISFEPLLERVIMTDTAYLTPLGDEFCNWLIIGACTGTKDEVASLCSQHPGIGWQHLNANKFVATPRIEWVREIVEAADQAGIPVFLKDNLRPLLETDLAYPNWAQDPHTPFYLTRAHTLRRDRSVLVGREIGDNF